MVRVKRKQKSKDLRIHEKCIKLIIVVLEIILSHGYNAVVLFERNSIRAICSIVKVLLNEDIVATLFEKGTSYSIVQKPYYCADIRLTKALADGRMIIKLVELISSLGGFRSCL